MHGLCDDAASLFLMCDKWQATHHQPSPNSDVFLLLVTTHIVHVGVSDCEIGWQDWLTRLATIIVIQCGMPTYLTD
jgi:hypothetical protein